MDNSFPPPGPDEEVLLPSPSGRGAGGEGRGVVGGLEKGIASGPLVVPRPSPRPSPRGRGSQKVTLDDQGQLALRRHPDELRASYDFCVDLSRREAKNFYYSFLVLPGERRRSMCALYAFLRRTDDLADAPGPIERKAPALDAWRRGLDDSLDGRANAWPGLLALADSVRKHEIPPRYLHDVIDGVEMDLTPRPFSTFDDLSVYCYRVASVVGLSCLHIWGYRSDHGKAEALAESCGIALQLTNIIRDVREDALQGRVYLPQDDLRRFGIDPAELAAPRPTGRVRALLEYQGARAYEYYRKAEPLVSRVDPVGRPVLLAIVGIYRALLDEIVRRDYDVHTSRVALPGWRKLAITARSLVARFARTGVELDAEPLLAESTRYG
jgi:phytoene synthase